MFTNHIITVCVSGEVNKVIVRNEYDTIMLILDNKQEMERNGKIEMVVSSIQVKIPQDLYDKEFKEIIRGDNLMITGCLVTDKVHSGELTVVRVQAQKLIHRAPKPIEGFGGSRFLTR
ncbi:hypothetical protein [Klebsiella pneumoniae]|uniref:hypothetical protein n=1 Tax=Klebsiella pneumoniae TaxID=573 RepID=UPI0013D72B28|nr:hypothetical protein [Klebsiella pneumoniae]